MSTHIPASRLVWRTLLQIVLLAACTRAAAASDQRYSLRGMVMKVAASHQSFVVSHDSIAGVMEAMTMSFDVRDPNELEGVTPGITVEFTLVIGRESAAHSSHTA